MSLCMPVCLRGWRPATCMVGNNVPVMGVVAGVIGGLWAVGILSTLSFFCFLWPIYIAYNVSDWGNNLQSARYHPCLSTFAYNPK